VAADVDAWAQAGLMYELSEGVAWLRLNRPERRNAMDHYPGGQGPHGMGLRDALLEAIRNVTENKAAKVAVITGNGSVFSAGADLKVEALEIEPEHRRNPTVARDDGLLYGWYRLLESIWRSETPFIAAVNGPAIGGGCQLALACDLIYASETATFWEIFARIGLPLEGGAAWLLTRSLSLPLAKEMALLSEPLSAARAVEWRLINGCVPDEQLESVVAGVARKLANLGAPSKGPAASEVTRDVSARLGHIKGQLNAAWEQTMWQTFREEAALLNLPAGDVREEGRDPGTAD
jgi:2-(1,2-epoxy-1,2-dihydrophenyl)acetyl-CoA isomerase